MDAIWEKDFEIPQFPQLQGDLKTDVLIIGGGMGGLLCAWNLHQAGVDVALIEQNRIMGGVSGRTTAKLTSQHGLCFNKLLDKYGAEKARLYWQANQEAVATLGDLAKTAQCDFSYQNSYLYSTGNNISALVKELKAYEQLKIPYIWEDKVSLPFPVTGVLGMEQQGQFHPLKLAAHIAKDLKIYENTKALGFVGNQVKTPNGVVTAEKILITTHFPMLNKHGAYFLKLYQQRSYVVGLKNTDRPDGMYLDCEENGLSVRSAGQWLLLGGGGHRTGKPGLGWKLPETAANNFYPQGKIEARWATQDCMSLDGIPYIGCYSKNTPNLYVATGFGKWGMSTSMVAAKLLSDLVQGRENPYAQLFSPSRSLLHKQLLINGAETTVNLLRPVKPRCPHLGCALHWNKEERSWDCSCHGSRFDAEGKLLNGPATGNLKQRP